jgi:ATP-dependent DNA ligase
LETFGIGSGNFVASVKNGFVPATRKKGYEALKKLETTACPYVNLPEKRGGHMDREKMKSVHWLQPLKPVELAFNERTPSGHLRHSRYLRLR